MSDGESIPQSEDQSNKEGSNISTTEDEDHVVEFNLANPDDVEMKLDNLTDEEMEKLLKQAYKINNELKKELSRKEREQSASSSSSRATPQSAKVRRSADLVQLPPIRNGKERRGFTPLGPKTQQLYSSPVSSNRQKARTAVRQPEKPRPEWNNRFTM